MQGAQERMMVCLTTRMPVSCMSLSQTSSEWELLQCAEGSRAMMHFCANLLNEYCMLVSGSELVDVSNLIDYLMFSANL